MSATRLARLYETNLYGIASNSLHTNTLRNSKSKAVLTMQFTTQALVLSSALASTTSAAHVFSTFYQGKRPRRKQISYDVANSGCFNITINAHNIMFSQAPSLGNHPPAKGPYCLHGFNASSCPGPITGDAREEFGNMVPGLLLPAHVRRTNSGRRDARVNRGAIARQQHPAAAKEPSQRSSAPHTSYAPPQSHSISTRTIHPSSMHITHRLTIIPVPP
ncbi:hypothetical protein BDU57DRAFT_583185 [Ampelomyces quisqualis]|uniref:Uncharacterized protein n=1 Tax=Ampelomyces quisqualis TaxID=50730 RepID=A0A6A5QB09_AMPQU|nr:hypothetical protein BDU57DRAFT_583185 [Ampelomyces quisqualis]